MKRFQQSAALLGIIGLCACSPQPSPSAESVATAAPADSVVALGRLEPEGEVIRISVPNAQDSRVNQVLVKEGDWVKADQVLAILQGIDRRKADLRDAETDVKLQRAEVDKVKQGGAKKAQITAQRAAIVRLQAQLKTTTKQKQAAIASAKATLREAQLTYQRRQNLIAQGAIARADLDLAQRDLDTSIALLNERHADLEQTRTTLEAEIQQEQANLAELQEVRPVDVEIAEARLTKAQIAVEQRQAILEDVQVRAPIAGQILRINTRVGEQVNTSQGIMELARTDRMFVTAEISELDINKVRKGQRATITSEYGGFSDEIQGTVEQIGLQIGRRVLQEAASGGSTGSPLTDQNARIVTVKIRVDPNDNAKVTALTYMQVRVKLDITDEQNDSD
ncbi:HlyD family efflux transporter periplasmic adaptor subunit [Myxacorys almedinensis]|uniref:HlyD family efflux transporter periplasmic adaptor subunit n=1 Tax=Myxacorys almedinensis A TaxID=2690445 RepID=A0A8J8CJ35_9CYAN|nr:HlyD family efflux transporter periplasmic adaptor subunit [Myxacorys almedinensis]NDJ18588.1 HlyD family efflux transporter periplasmic adaptor subunit [Myxacorys almedinensis A]